MMGQMQRQSVLLSLAVSAWLTAVVCGATVTVSDVQLSANEPDQWIDIIVTGGDMVAGVDLFVQVGDGGPQLANYGLPPGKAGPAITDVELKVGTIFQGVSDVPANLGSTELPQTAVFTLSLVGTTPTVAAQGKLARVQIDTTGFFGGTWDLHLDNALPFDIFGGPYATNFAGLPANVQNGTISIPITRGDYNGNQQFDVSDVDTLAAAIRAESTDQGLYDLNSDHLVDWQDYRFWVKSYARTYAGDANLDGEFNSGDLVNVLAAGRYEDNIVGNAGWATGDWNGDQDFTTSDLVVAFADGGYELGPRAAVAVPEPASWTLFLVILLLIDKPQERGRRKGDAAN